MEYLVDKLLPKYQLHLIGGPSGAGKTTWLFQQIEEWRNGRDVLGQRSHPEDFVYVACDRSLDNLEETRKRVGTAPFPILSLIDSDHIKRDFMQVLEAARQLVPSARVVFIDGFATLMEDPSKLGDYGSVSEFLVFVAKFCKKYGITIVAVLHSTKTKEGEQFLNPRQRVLGSVAWGGYAETIIVIEPTKPDDVECQERRVLILPRNWKESEHIYVLDDNGRLVDAPLEAPTLDERLDKLKVGIPVTTRDISDWTNTPRSTLARWIAKQVTAGRLEQVSKGVYRKPFSN